MNTLHCTWTLSSIRDVYAILEDDITLVSGSSGSEQGADGRKEAEEGRGPVWPQKELAELPEGGMCLANSWNDRAVCWQHRIHQQAAIKAAARIFADHQRR